MDNASRQTGAGVSLQLKAPTGERIEQAIRLDFHASKNETEYEAICVLEKNSSYAVTLNW